MRAVWRGYALSGTLLLVCGQVALKQRMNERGVSVDFELCRGAEEADEIAKKRMGDRTEELILGRSRAHDAGRSGSAHTAPNTA